MLSIQLMQVFNHPQVDLDLIQKILFPNNLFEQVLIYFK